jgi:hypothetical protein
MEGVIMGLLNQVAQHDTPEQVNVPNNWNGLALWAVGRFGGIIIATAMCAAGLYQVYQDLQTTNMRMLSMLEARAVSDSKLADALNQLTHAVESMKRAVEQR